MFATLYNRILIVCGLIICQNAISWPSTFYRTDLKEAFNKIICSQGIQSPQYRSMWANEVYDAGVITYIIEIDGDPKNHKSAIEKEINSLLKKENHRGYAYGRCRNGRFWIATTPAPVKLKRKGQAFEVRIKNLTPHCRDYRLDFAAAEFGFSRRVFNSKYTRPKASLLIDPTLLDSGALSFTCYPTGKTYGAQAWYMIPAKDGPKKEPILKQSLMAPGPSKLVNWINSVRSIHGLQPLDHGNKVIQKASQVLVANNTTTKHIKTNMRGIRHSLDQLGGRFLGENRVQSQSDMEAAWMLWNSPRHRHLLLLRKANNINIIKKKTRQSQLSVLVFSRL